MKILQINSVISYGSTGRIARDLYDYLEANGHECVIAYGRGDSVPGYNTIKIGSDIDQKMHAIYSRLTDRHGFASKKATQIFIEQIKEYKPDVIHLHNIHGYYINIKILFEYLATTNIPVVWLLHDQWAVSGHSAYFELDDNNIFPKKLSSRKELKNYPKTIGISQFKRNLHDKEKLFTSVKNMTIITPSNWLTEMMQRSFLNKYLIKTIYNGVDTDVFRVDDSNVGVLREKWGAKGKKIILGVASVWEERKGLEDFIELSLALPSKDYKIVLVGVEEEDRKKIPNEIICINKTSSVEELRDIYNVADIFVNPTYFDNFPTVNIEALSCGTPVITYDTGGSSESINYNTGSVINQGDIYSLVNEINKWDNKKSETSKACRQRVMKNFSKELVYENYLMEYTKIVK